MRQTDLNIHSRTNRQTDLLTDIYVDSITDRHDIRTHRQRDRQTELTQSGSINSQSGRQTDTDRFEDK